MKRYFSHSEGYVRLKIDGKFVLEHRLVMEKKLGRKLLSEEVVHHKDRDRKNNDPDNLELMAPGEHSKHHGSGKSRKTTTVVCDQCGKSFEKEVRKLNYFKKVGYKNLFCGRSCKGKFHQHHIIRNI